LWSGKGKVLRGLILAGFVELPITKKKKEEEAEEDIMTSMPFFIKAYFKGIFHLFIRRFTWHCLIH
jgi:hypothetical protein